MTLDVDEHGFLGWLLEWWTRLWCCHMEWIVIVDDLG